MAAGSGCEPGKLILNLVGQRDEQVKAVEARAYFRLRCIEACWALTSARLAAEFPLAGFDEARHWDVFRHSTEKIAFMSSPEQIVRESVASDDRPEWFCVNAFVVHWPLPFPSLWSAIVAGVCRRTALARKPPWAGRRLARESAAAAYGFLTVTLR
jgi:hypothetical protein